MGHPDLRRALLARYPWLAGVELGPQSVTAGDCDRCGVEARLVAPCGPPPRDLLRRAGPDWALGRGCTIALGDGIWCGGHAAEGEDARAWLAALPQEADVVARLWWVATGEISFDASLLAAAGALGHGPSIKDDERYERLREQGESKEKAARMANTDPRRGGESPSYEEWTVDDLRKRAAEIGVDGQSDMDKSQLIDALRNH
jgi:hypothetical protein